MAVGNKGAKLDLVIRQGADFRLRLTFRNPDNTLMDLTGIIPRSQIRDSYKSPTAVNITCEVAPDPLAGWIDLVLPNATTAAFTCGPDENDVKSIKVWDLEFVDSLSLVTAMVYGEAKIFREITKNA